MTESFNTLTAGFKKIPGITINLPSNGVMYTNQINDTVKESGEVHVRPLSMRDDLAFKTPDLLISGSAVKDALIHCVDEIVNPGSMYACDVNTLLVALRIATTGEIMQVKIKNDKHNPEDPKSQSSYTFDVDLRNCIRNGKTIKSIDDLTVTLENGQVVIIRPMTFDESIKMLKMEIDSMGVELDSDDARVEYIKQGLQEATTMALNMIVSVDGITDKAMIEEWYNEIPRNLYKPVRDLFNKISELGPNLEFDAYDPVTKEKWKSKVPIDPLDFFDFG